MTGELVVESAETQAKEDTSAAEIKDAVLDIKSEVRDITDQTALADRVAEKVLSSLKLMFQQQEEAASGTPEPPAEATPEATTENQEQDVAPKRSHRLFRKIGKREE